MRKFKSLENALDIIRRQKGGKKLIIAIQKELQNTGCVNSENYKESPIVYDMLQTFSDLELIDHFSEEGLTFQKVEYKGSNPIVEQLKQLTDISANGTFFKPVALYFDKTTIGKLSAKYIISTIGDVINKLYGEPHFIKFDKVNFMSRFAIQSVAKVETILAELKKNNIPESILRWKLYPVSTRRYERAWVIANNGYSIQDRCEKINAHLFKWDAPIANAFIKDDKCYFNVYSDFTDADDSMDKQLYFAAVTGFAQYIRVQEGATFVPERNLARVIEKRGSVKQKS